LEIVLGSDDLDAATAEQWGYLNRALPASELDGFVDQLAYRIAGFPGGAIALAKESVNQAELPLREGLAEEAHLFQQTMRTDAAQSRMKQYMAMGGQTREVEMKIGEIVLQLGQE
jgi:enoyl-CoA hydratase/carnithine racemase